ncbi:MAG: DUF4062 domain-containing protein, partial [Bacilli bacterium]|nr:DUF4062 domain-containing protein [Bacilli bacterium]
LDMFYSYIARETDENLLFPNERLSNPERAFLGIDKIRHQYIKQVEEQAFDYIYRHTFGRPRDLMHICSNLYPLLYNGDVQNIEKVIRHGVNQGSLFLLENYINELEPFIYQLTRNNLTFLCQKLISNALDKNLLRSVCFDYNHEFEEISSLKYGSCMRGKNCVDCHLIHPFCQLYNVGLLGEFHELKGNGFEVRFKQYDSITNAHFHSLPNTKLYCLHPALANKVEEIRCRSNLIYDHANAIIGHGESFDSKKVDSLIRKLRSVCKKYPAKRVFISSTCYDLGDTRKKIKNTLRDKGFDVFISDDDEFNADTEGLHTHDHCISEMLKCDYMIFIVSGRYGGEYRGSKYTADSKEIGDMNTALKRPSISLMEFYLAKKNNIPMSVFIDDKVSNERNIYNHQPNKSDYRITNVTDTRVFDIITFITRQINVWRQEYRDEEHLLNLINIALPR